MSIRVLVADDHTIVRNGLRAMIEKKPGLAWAGEAANGREAVERCATLRPDVAVLDITMPVLNGIDACRRIVQDCPNTKVIGLSMHTDRRYVAEMLGAGASGYVLKEAAFEELHRAVQVVHEGRTYLSPTIAGQVVEGYLEKLSREDGSRAAQLSPREREVLQLMAEGGSTKEIASALGVSVKTIESHRQQIMRKLDLHSVAELTKYAIREGLTSLDT